MSYRLAQADFGIDQVDVGGVPPTDGSALMAAFGPYLQLLIGAGILLVATYLVLAVIRKIARARYQRSAAFKKTVLLVTVPKEASEKGDAGLREKSLQEIQEDIGIMENVMSGIGGLRAERGFKAWFVGRDDSIAFEVVADHGLVTFYIAAPVSMQDFVVQQVQAQYPLAQIEAVPDYNIFTPKGVVVGAKLGFRREHYFPIKSFKKIEYDPLNALTNALAKVDKVDGAAIQILVRSAKKEWRRPAMRLVRYMQQGKTFYKAQKLITWWGLLWYTLFAVTPKKPDEKETEKDYRHKMTPQEEEMVKSIDEKASSLGLDVNIRIVAAATTQAQATTYLNNIVGAFAQFNIPQYGNAFVKYGQSSKKLVRDFIFRHFQEKPHMVMSGTELAGIFHLPLSSTETPNIRWLSARKAPPPANLPNEGLLLGFIDYRDEKIQVRIKQEDRFRHMYLIGKSGTGKSEHIANMAVQDIENGYGVCVLDPHGDLVETVLSKIPKERADDVVIFDPSDMERPIGLNMLESPTEEMKDYVVGEMIAIFYKLFPPEMIGPMFEHNMRNFMLTLMSDPENPGTIAEIPRLIADAAFQKAWVAKVKDPVVRSFWENEIAKTSDFHKSEMLGYLISKVGRFVENTMMRNIIGQQKSAFDFPGIMNDSKILLVNLSKGKIGDINANLLGLIIVTKLQMAAMSRANIVDKSARKDFMLYIDEFHNFITPSIATILSEARKYRLSLVVAHQYMAQLAPKGDSEIRDAVLGNVGTMMIGRIGIEDAQLLEKEFQPVFTALDLVNVEKFSWNTKLLVDNTAMRAFNMKAYPPVKGDRRIAEALKQLSRLKFGRDRMIVEQEILERTQLRAQITPGTSEQSRTV